MNSLLQDIRYGLRMLAKSPGFAAVAILTLALGIGANTALFTIVNGVLLNPLPYRHPEQLVTLHESKPNFATGSISYPNFRDWQKENRSFSAIAVYRSNAFTLTGAGAAMRVRAQLISSDFFPILGVQPVIGRTFRTGEDEIGAAPIALISEGLWQRKFSASPEILGKTIALDSSSFTVVGVIPASFDLQMGSFRAAEVYLPIGDWGNPALKVRVAGLGIHGIGRLKPGVTVEQARADMKSVTESLAAEYPEDNKEIGAAVIPLRQSMVGRYQTPLFVLLGAVAFVLLIACVNVANLTLARSTGRTREFAIRAALGAGRGRLLRQLLTESVLLSFAGGALGLLLAAWGTSAALKVLPATLPRASEIHIDARVLLFTAAISFLAGILFGLTPAARTSRPNLNETLKEGGRGASGARHRAQGVLVLVEMAMALVLLTGAGLLLRSLAVLWNSNPGFQPGNVLTFGLGLPPAMTTASPAAIRAAFRQVHNQIESTPGIEAASFSWGALPLAGDDEQFFWFNGEPKPQATMDMKWTLKYVVEPGYLKAMGLQLLRGRFLTPRDDEHAPIALVVDDVVAKQYFGDADPIGKRLNLDDYDKQGEIVGIVGHVKQWGLDSDDTEKLRAQMYLAFMQLPEIPMKLTAGGVGVVVRADSVSPGLFDSLRDAVEKQDAESTVYDAATMNDIMAQSLAARRFSMILFAVFAVLALVLASVGIYGVISYLVGQRTHEIGIRMALGAQRKDVLALVLRDGARLALGGVAVGIVAALGLTRLMAKLLYGVSATDPLTFGGVAVVLIGVALLACYIPARRAARVDPIVALRYE